MYEKSHITIASAIAKATTTLKGNERNSVVRIAPWEGQSDTQGYLSVLVAITLDGIDEPILVDVGPNKVSRR